MPAPVKSLLRFVDNPRLHAELVHLLTDSTRFSPQERAALQARLFEHASIREAAHRSGLSRMHVHRLELRTLTYFQRYIHPLGLDR